MEYLLNCVWTSRINTFTDIKLHLSIGGTLPDMAVQLVAALNSTDMTFTLLFMQFLQGSGISSREAFDTVRDQFNSLVDLSAIDDTGFRSHYFC